MEAIFQAQAAFKRDLNLTRVRAVRNANYQAHGTKSYVYLLNRFGFAPTLPGPYYQGTRFTQRGLAGPQFTAPLGGRLRGTHMLMKRKKGHHAGSGDAAGGGDGTGTGAGSGTGSGTGSGSGGGAAAHEGQVTAEDQQNDSMYLCEVSIGTPPQKLLLDLDTGSSDLWVFSTELPKSSQQSQPVPGGGSPVKHVIFDPTKSSTFKKSTGQTWKITYGDQSSASGDVGTDVVSIGGLAIQNQCVELAKKLSPEFAQGTGDGLLGLAFQQLNTVTKGSTPDPQPTPVDNMISQQDIPQTAELFTSAFYSERDVDAATGKAKESFYTFGWIDTDLVTASGEDIHWTPLDTSQGWWMFPSTTASINGKSIAIPPPTTGGKNMAIADTGTTLAVVSDAVCEALYKAIPGAKYDDENQGYVFPMTVAEKDLPEFSVDVGGKQFVIQKEDLAFAPTGDGNWYGGVQSRGSNDFDILGDAFLKSIYAVSPADVHNQWVAELTSGKDLGPGKLSVRLRA